MYTCPKCKKEFEKSGRDKNNYVICPHCETYLTYRRTKDRDTGEYIRQYIITTEEEFRKKKVGLTGKLPTKVSRIEVTGKADNPRIFKLDGGDVDYEVVHRSGYFTEVFCPACGKKATRNNVLKGQYDFQCRAYLDPKSNNGRKGKCNAKIRFIFV